jgi:hypothetical protein
MAAPWSTPVGCRSGHEGPLRVESGPLAAGKLMTAMAHSGHRCGWDERGQGLRSRASSSSRSATTSRCSTMPAKEPLLPRARNRGLLSAARVREEGMARRVGIVGIGVMGMAMMRNVVRGGLEVVGYDVAEGAMARLAEAGGIAAASPRDAAEKAEVLITSLPNVDAFEQVMAGHGGIAPRPASGLGSGGPALD